ncbi:MAG TPA: T9SS type A sorting domain-containing protein [bacterium]|jgi:photosystem II stability/assembly factor-like uncharacterized protein
MMHLRYWLLLSAGVLLSCSPLMAAWTLFPAGQPTYGAAIADSSGQKMLLSSAVAGIWQTENGGGDWQPVSDRFPPYHRIGHTDFDALDAAADTLLASVDVYSPAVSGTLCLHEYSFDGGRSWRILADSSSDESGDVAFWRVQHNVWLHLRNGRFLRSQDFGQTWDTVSTTPTGFQVKLYQPSGQDSTLYYVAPTRGELYRSANLGDTWTRILCLADYVPGYLMNLRSMVRVSTGRLLATFGSAWGARSCGVLSSWDDGQTWDILEGLESQIQDAVQIVEDDFQPGLLFMTGRCPGGLLRSTDGGDSWMPCGSGLPQDTVGALSLYQNPFSGSLYVVLSDHGLYQSRDHGQTWQPLSTPPLGRPDGDFTILDDVVHYTGYRLEPPYSAWQPFPYPESHSDTAIILSRVLRKSGDTLLCYAMKHLADDTGDHRFGQMAHSSDNGTTWTFDPFLPWGFSPWNVHEHTGSSGTRLIASMSDFYGDTLFLSQDLGSTWRMLPRLPFQASAKEIVLTDSCVYILQDGSLGSQSAVCRSADLGQTWQYLGSLTGPLSNLTVIGNDVFVTSATDLLHWEDGTRHSNGLLPFGESYYEIPGSNQVIVIPRPNPVLVAIQMDSSALWISSDLGASWEVLQAEFPFASQNVLMENLTYDAPRNRLWVAAGIGPCYLDLSEVLSDTGKPLVFKPSDYAVLSAYPNPFNGSTRIRFDLLTRQKVTLDLYDLQGRHVQTLCDEIRDAGRHEIGLDGEGLASGTYFVKLQSAEMTRTEKILLLK